MRRLFCIVSLSTVALASAGQSDCKKLNLLFNPVTYISFDHPLVDPRPGAGVNFSFEYELNKRWSIATNFMYGSFQSTNSQLNRFPANLPFSPDVSQRNENSHYSFTVQYRVQFTGNISAKLGTGFGWYSYTNSFQRPMFDSDGRYVGAVFDSERSGDAAFPVFVSVDHAISPKLTLGLRGGFFTAPFYSVFGWNFGPGLAIKI